MLTPAVTSSPLPEPSPTQPLPTSVPTAEPEPEIRVCAPLASLSQSDLASAISNPFNPPPPGSDDPHEGIDLSVLLPGTGIAVSGEPVQAVLAGSVSLAVMDRFPYGNAVMIETPLEPLLDAGWELPPPDEREPVLSALTCPGKTELPPGGPGQSLYLVYAHLLEPPRAAIGDAVACGAPLGKIGDTGNALNPHLHLEVRVGPSGMTFPGMSHYDASASVAEMDAYCVWRIGGDFRLLDPLSLLLMTDW